MENHVLSLVNMSGWILSITVTFLLYCDARVRLGALTKGQDTLLAAVERALLTPTVDVTSSGKDAPPPRSERHVTDPPDSPAPITRPSTAPGDGNAARTKSSRPPPPVQVEDASTLSNAMEDTPKR